MEEKWCNFGFLLLFNWDKGEEFVCEGVIKLALYLKTDKLFKHLNENQLNHAFVWFCSGIMRPGLNAILGPTGSGKSS